MAMTLFTILNGLGVVFLVYVLVQFWKEGHRQINLATRDKVIGFWVKDSPTVLVVTHPVSGGLQVEPAPVSHCAHGGLSVVSSEVWRSGLQDRQLHRDSPDGADETLLKRSSAR
jgi:hypothetical protein